MDSMENAQNCEFYRKRFELQSQQLAVLRQENQVLRTELANLKTLVKKIALPSSKKPQENESLRQILEFQHQRIETLEASNENLKKKYEKLLFESSKDGKNSENIEENQENIEKGAKESKSKALFARFSHNSEELQKANKTIRMLEEKLKEMAASSAKEIIDLKAKLTKQTATLLINNSEGDNRVQSANNLNNESKNSLFKKKDGLAPLEKNNFAGFNGKNVNRSMFEHGSSGGDNEGSLFKYKKKFFE